VPRMLLLCLAALACLAEGSQRSEPMFTSVTHRLLPPDYDSNPTQLNYGVAVTDLDADGDFEIVVAGRLSTRLPLADKRAYGGCPCPPLPRWLPPGLDDPYQHGRGVALADFNRDGRLDVVYGNWNGPHRLFLQAGAPGRVRFRDIATPKFSMPSPVRTVITADLDNEQELEPEGRGTGGAVTDFDGDGLLDLILSHGESMAQPISIFKGTQGTSNNWLRVIPRTRFGAFARGAKVVLFTRRSGAHLRIIDGGSGYLCQMEPVAHFGLGAAQVAFFGGYPSGGSWPRPRRGALLPLGLGLCFCLYAL
ncbi:PREDICTED: cartilage acidic protein 1, partial [Tinamus guttatus]|uniref:cartilage acidic protein 1 n=1 Tax=Tinamus guttatus TaxID=94827 RepID=UPI00052ED80A